MILCAETEYERREWIEQITKARENAEKIRIFGASVDSIMAQPAEQGQRIEGSWDRTLIVANFFFNFL
jgi:hypothetical protein